MCTDKFTRGFDEKILPPTGISFYFGALGAMRSFKYKKEVIKRDGISLAEVQKRQNGVSCLAA